MCIFKTERERSYATHGSYHISFYQDYNDDSQTINLIKQTNQDKYTDTLCQTRGNRKEGWQCWIVIRNPEKCTIIHRVEQVAVQVNTEQGQPQQRSRLEFKPGSVRPRSPKTEETASMVLPTGRGRGWKKTHTARRAHPISTMSARVVIQT